jgi:hypothetical protein
MNARIVVSVILGVCLGSWAARAQDVPVPKPAAGEKPASAEPNLHPQPPEPVPPERLEASIARGVAFLVANQRKDGSWGSPKLTGVAIVAGIGSHHAFNVATSALAVSALIEVDDGSPAVAQAIERGEEFLLREIPEVRRDDPMLIYNVWAHAYAIQALCRMEKRKPGDVARVGQIRSVIRQQFERLVRYESALGGWGYYDFTAGTQRPASDSTSFVNAAVLVALHEAKELGLEPPPKLIQRAIDITLFQRLPDFSYLYGTYLRQMPRMGINLPGGSLGRSQACNLALRLWGDEKVTDEVMKTWLDRLISRNGWLDMGRKRPIPHESFFMVAGYFYYFGHYYAALEIALLPPADRAFYQDHLARILMNVQEADGSWWDYPLYDYHRPYGTAFALMSLKCCRKPARP